MSTESVPDSDRITRLLAKYLAGDATPAEEQSLRERVRYAGHVRDALGFDVEGNVDTAWDAVRERLSGAGTPPPIRHRQRFWMPNHAGASALRAHSWAAAGVMALIAVLVLSLQMTGLFSRGGNERRYATATGQQASFMLDDGTRVTLAPRSVLRVASFRGDIRAVSLDGEAYFDVAHAGGAPFVVQTGTVRTRVLGTAFTVRRYPRDGVTRVAVASGKVSVSAKNPNQPSVTLSAGRVGTVSDTSATTMAAGDDAQYTGWRNGWLVFYEAPASDVLDALSRWYGYEFHWADPSMDTQKLTAVLSTRSSSAALSTVKLLLNVDLSFDGNIVTLVPRRVTRPALPNRREIREGLSNHKSEVGR